MGFGNPGPSAIHLIGQQKPNHLDRARLAIRAHHRLHEPMIQRDVRAAIRRAVIPKQATCHAFRHSAVYPALFGTTHLLEDGYDLSACNAQAGIRTIQELLGHKDVETTMVYTHVLNRGGKGVRSPVDSL